MAKFIDLILRGKDLLSGKSNAAAQSIGELKTEIKSLDKELKAVEDSQAAISVFKELSTESERLSSALDEAKGSVTKYAAEQAQASAQAAQAGQAFDKLKTDAKELNTSYKEQSKSLNTTENSLKTATVKMREHSEAVNSSKTAIAETTAKYKEQKQQLDLLEAKYKGSKTPIDNLNNSYKVARAELAALEQTQKKQVAQLERAETSYKASQQAVQQLQTSQSSYRASLAQTETALNETNSELAEQAAKQKEANIALDTAARNYKAAASAVAKFEKDLTSTNSKLDKAESKLKSADIATDKLAESSKRLAAQQKDLSSKTEKAVTSLANIRSKLTGVSAAINKAGSGIDGFTSRLAALGGTYLSIHGITNALWGMIDTGASFQRMRIQFEGIMGSVASGEQAFQWVKDFARDTPLQMNEVTQAFVFLKGAGLDPMDGTLKAITDSVAKYTGGTDKLTNVTRQLAQAWAKGKINAKDFNAVMDNDLPVWNLLSQATGKQVGELLKLSEQSKLGRYELKLLFEEMKNDAPGAAARLMGAFSGQLEQASHNIKVFFDLIAQSGALEALQDKLSNFNIELRKMADDGSLKVFAQELSDRFVQMVSDVSNATKAIFTDLKGFASAISTAFNVIAVPVNVFSMAIRGVIAAFAGLAKVTTYYSSKVLGVFSDDLEKSTLKLADFFAQMEKQAFKQYGEDLTDLNNAIKGLGLGSDDSSKSINKVAESAKTLQKVIEPLAGVLNATKAEAIAMAKGMGDNAKSFKEANIPAEQLTATIGVLVEKLKDDPSPEVRSIVTQLIKQYGNLGDKLKTTGEDVDSLEAKFQQAGGKTLKDLEDKVESAALSFNAFQGAGKAVDQLRQSFTTLLNAQVELSKANGTSLSSTLEVTASQLGLSDAFEQSSNEVDRHNATVNGTLPLYEKLLALKNRLKNTDQEQQNVNINTEQQTEKQKEAQEKLNKANAEAVSHAGANVAFQKLWNEARERSVKLYDLLSLSTEELNQKTKDLGASLSSAFRTQSWSNILKPVNDLNNAAKRNELQAIAQTRAYKALFERIERGSVSLDELSYYAREAGQNFDKLDQTNLSALQDQIARAKQATADLKNELVDTVHNLKNELDDLQGNQDKTLARDYQADKLELQERLKQAEKTGDRNAISDAKEALEIAEKIYRIRSKNIADEKNEEIKTTKTVTEKTNNNNNIKEVRQVQDIRYTVTFSIGNKSSTFSSNTSSNVTELMQALAEAGFTVTRS